MPTPFFEETPEEKAKKIVKSQEKQFIDILNMEDNPEQQKQKIEDLLKVLEEKHQGLGKGLLRAQVVLLLLDREQDPATVQENSLGNRTELIRTLSDAKIVSLKPLERRASF